MNQLLREGGNLVPGVAECGLDLPQVALVVFRRQLAVLEHLQEVHELVAQLRPQPQDVHDLRLLHLREAVRDQHAQDVEQAVRSVGLEAQVAAELQHRRVRQLVESLQMVSVVTGGLGVDGVGLSRGLNLSSV